MAVWVQSMLSKVRQDGRYKHALSSQPHLPPTYWWAGTSDVLPALVRVVPGPNLDAPTCKACGIATEWG